MINVVENTDLFRGCNLVPCEYTHACCTLLSITGEGCQDLVYT